MKIAIIVLSVLLLILGAIVNNQSQKLLARDKKIKGLQCSADTKPSVSISHFQVDSVDSAGNVYGVELHSGETGSSDSYNSSVVLAPSVESEYWAKYPYQISKEVYVLRVSTWGETGRSWTEVITPSW